MGLDAMIFFFWMLSFKPTAQLMPKWEPPLNRTRVWSSGVLAHPLTLRLSSQTGADTCHGPLCPQGPRLPEWAGDMSWMMEAISLCTPCIPVLRCSTNMSPTFGTWVPVMASWCWTWVPTGAGQEWGQASLCSAPAVLMPTGAWLCFPLSRHWWRIGDSSLFTAAASL